MYENMFKIIKMTPSIRTLIIFSTVFIWIIGIICMIENMKISEQIRQDDEQIEKLERAYNELLIQTQKREEESLNEEKFYDEMIREYNEEEKQQEKKLYGILRKKLCKLRLKSIKELIKGNYFLRRIRRGIRIRRKYS